ncbi:MAG: hypothetical protein RLZZ182_197 [Pseudomonadota bacterium]
MSTIEQEIQQRASVAPRVTPADIEAAIAAEYYTTADRAFRDTPAMQGMQLLTLCVLVLKNGFTITGTSACASPENFDADIGRKVARADAVRQVWPLLGYALRDKLHHAPAVAAAVAQLQISASNCETNAPIHASEGRHEQAECSRANGESYRTAIERLQA